MSKNNMYFTEEIGKEMIKDIEIIINGEKMESSNIPNTPTQYKKIDHFKEWLNKLEHGIIDEIPNLSEITLEEIKEGFQKMKEKKIKLNNKN